MSDPIGKGVLIVDYGVGNLASIRNMLRKIGVEASISGDIDAVASADKLILPGVGAFDTCADKLDRSGLREVLSNRVLSDKVPILGICVGMQLLLEGSEEGELKGLGWVRGRNIRFRADRMPAGLRIPHMGWTDVHAEKPSPLLMDIEDPRFYFVHAYHAEVEDPSDALLTAEYGYRFTAAVEHGNILGVQFHPEKSHRFGMRLLSNFVAHYHQQA